MELFNEAMSLRSSDYQKSSLLYYQLRERQNELPDKYRLELVYLEAYLQMMHGSYSRAIETHSNLTMVKDPNVALRAYSNMLIIEILNRDYLSASAYLVPMLEIIESAPTDLKLTFLNLSFEMIGTFYNHLEDYNSALFYLEKVVPSVYSQREQCNYSVEIIKTKVLLDITPINDPAIAEVSKLCQQANEPVMYHGFLADLAGMLIKKEQYRAVINLLAAKVSDVKATNFIMNQAEFYSFLATSYHHVGELGLAEYFALKTLSISKDIPEKLPSKLALEVIYQQSLNKPDKQKSYQYLQSLIEAADDYTANEQLKVLALEQAKVDFKDLINDIQKYNEQVSLENKIRDKKVKTNKIFSLYVFFERLIHLALIALVIYQLRTLYKEIKAIKNEKSKLVLDKTTKAFNRQIFIKKANTLLQQYKTQDEPVAIILFNFDKFRQINHLQGNDRADWLLKTSIRQCLSVIPKQGVLGRLGGDEFALTIPGCTVKTAEKVAEQLKQEFNKISNKKTSFKVSFSASFGVTDTTISGYEFFDLIIDADSLIQKIKKQGGNAVKVFRKPETDSQDQLKSM